jgi:hypothetical protein
MRFSARETEQGVAELQALSVRYAARLSCCATWGWSGHTL